MMKKWTVSHFRKMKEAGEKIVMLTTYDAPSAALAARAGAEMLLVGDSLAMTMLGYANTLPLTLEESLMCAKAVRRGAPDAFIIGDMPFMSFQISPEETVRNAGRYLQEAYCDAVKLEGGAETAPLVARLVDAGIPVVAHIGLLPQRVLTSGGYKIQGKTEEAAARLHADAGALAAAGAMAIVLEGIPGKLAAEISRSVPVPTIGIGAGAGCDGQVQVWHDVLGLFFDFTPRHAKRYAEIGQITEQALKNYVSEVKSGTFPGPENTF